MTEGNQPGEGQAHGEDEPIRLKRDTDLPPQPAYPAHTSQQEWHRRGPEPTAYVPRNVSKRSPPQKPLTFLDVFRFPFSLAGVIHFLIFWLGPFFLVFFTGAFIFMCYGQILIFVAFLALFGYMYYYFSGCIIAAAKNERFAPDITLEDVPDFRDLLRRFLVISVCLLICFGPAIIYVFIVFQGGDNTFQWQLEPLYWGLFIAGCFFFPMLLLAAVMFDSFTVLNPSLIIGSIISTFLPYCFIVEMFFIMGLLMNYLVRSLTGWGPAFFAWGAVIYLMFIASYILGRFFRRYENRLNWEVKL